MEQGDYRNSYGQSHFPNPNPSCVPSDIYHHNPLSSTIASAPPLPAGYCTSDYAYYSPVYPPYPDTNSQHDQHQIPLICDLPYLRHDPLSNSSYSSSYNRPVDSTPANYGYQSESGINVEGAGKMDHYDDRSIRMQNYERLSFDDYGRPVQGLDRSNDQSPAGQSVAVVPKTEMPEDVKNVVQKFRVKLLAESVGQSNMDVLCQIRLDGIRMLDPATSRTLRIHPLEVVTRWEILDPTIFAFWAKSSTDAEPKRTRLQSNSYTTNVILDMVAAASVQLNEMGERKRPSNSFKASDQFVEKKKGFVDLMNLMKPVNEEKEHWVPDEVITKCSACSTYFGAFIRKHHCRNCGEIFCDKCTQGRSPLTEDEQAQPVRVCDRCMAEVTQRLSYPTEARGKFSGMQSHEDLAKKLQEEMERNCKTSMSELHSGGSVMHLQEVACPTCTVHLQVRIPTSSSSETIQCSVCQHPFLVTPR